MEQEVRNKVKRQTFPLICFINTTPAKFQCTALPQQADIDLEGSKRESFILFFKISLVFAQIVNALFYNCIVTAVKISV